MYDLLLLILLSLIFGTSIIFGVLLLTIKVENKSLTTMAGLLTIKPIFATTWIFLLYGYDNLPLFGIEYSNSKYAIYGILPSFLISLIIIFIYRKLLIGSYSRYMIVLIAFDFFRLFMGYTYLSGTELLGFILVILLPTIYSIIASYYFIKFDTRINQRNV